MHEHSFPGHDVLMHEVDTLADDVWGRYEYVENGKLQVFNTVPFVQSNVVVPLSANINDGIYAGVEKELVIAWVEGGAAQPKMVTNLVEPTMPLDAFIDKTDGRKELIIRVMERIHKR
jgi:hypothetical protein